MTFVYVDVKLPERIVLQVEAFLEAASVMLVGGAIVHSLYLGLPPREDSTVYCLLISPPEEPGLYIIELFVRLDPLDPNGSRILIPVAALPYKPQDLLRP